MSRPEFNDECEKLGVIPQSFGTGRVQVVEIPGTLSVMSERHGNGLVDFEATIKKIRAVLGNQPQE